MSEQRFTGTDTYVATDELMMAVNAAITLQRPLLVKGEPGTGKTRLAEEVARALDRGLVYLVDEQHGLALGLEGLPQLAADDVVGDVVHPMISAGKRCSL